MSISRALNGVSAWDTKQINGGLMPGGRLRMEKLGALRFPQASWMYTRSYPMYLTDGNIWKKHSSL